MQYAASEEPLELYVNGDLRDGVGSIGESGITDESGNGHHGTIGDTSLFYIDDM